MVQQRSESIRANFAAFLLQIKSLSLKMVLFQVVEFNLHIFISK
jgi:hypothetical protein